MWSTAILEHMANALGRRVPTDWSHVQKYALNLPYTVARVERIMRLPSWHWTWDQGQQGACVGYGSSMMMTILNDLQSRTQHDKVTQHRYDPEWLWNQAKIVDEFPDTNPGDDNGTTVSAACDVLRAQGHREVFNWGKANWSESAPDPANGITANRWATTVDEIRTAVHDYIPVAIGINWYSNFDTPTSTGFIKKEYWIGQGDLGTIRGGHCVCIFGADDRKQAFYVKNSWGRDYPLVWLPYTTMSRLLSEQGEATLVTDR